MIIGEALSTNHHHHQLMPESPIIPSLVVKSYITNLNPESRRFVVGKVEC